MRDVLAGSPYSLPPEAEPEIANLLLYTDKIRADVKTAQREAVKLGLFAQVTRDQNYREIYESNSLEFEGPDLKGTIEVLESTLAQKVRDQPLSDLLPALIAESPDMHAVIGLESARLLSHALLADASDRRLSEADVRSIHERVTAGKIYAGRYRVCDVEIQNAEHDPTPPVDISRQMHELIRWNAECAPGNPVLHAAALHAWLTHIHPFEDGNGRVARLLANMTLSAAGLPPAIVKAKTQRGAYLDALALSDQGGDIMPLAGLFGKTLVKYAADMQKPRFFRKLFANLVANRDDNRFLWFTGEVDQFLRLLAAELSTYRIRTTFVDRLDTENYENYRARYTEDATTLLIAQDQNGAELAVQVASPSHDVARSVDTEDLLPSLTFAVRASQYNLMAFVRIGTWQLSGLTELYFPLGPTGQIFALDDDQPKRGTPTSVAEMVAERIAESFSSGRVHQAPPTRRALPRLHGGPG